MSQANDQIHLTKHHSEALITDLPEENPPMPAGGAPGMGGMM